jgi:fatty acid desaturase
MHHAYLHTARDPDRWIYTSHMGSRQAMLRGLFEALTLRALFQRKRQVTEILASQRRDSTSKLKSPHALISKLLAQVIVIGIFVAAAGPWGLIYYGAVYLYGLLGVFTALVRIRTIVQHFHDSQLETSAGDLSLFTSRTTVSSLLQHVVLGARMDYHFEHHLFPHIPYYALRELHALLHEAGFFNAITAKTGQQLRTEDFVASFGSLTMRPGA